jgi:hypothetical protein
LAWFISRYKLFVLFGLYVAQEFVGLDKAGLCVLGRGLRVAHRSPKSSQDVAPCVCGRAKGGPSAPSKSCSGSGSRVDFVGVVCKEDGLAPIATLREMLRKPQNHNPHEHTHTRAITLRWGIGIMSPYFQRDSRGTSPASPPLPQGSLRQGSPTLHPPLEPDFRGVPWVSPRNPTRPNS